MITYKLVPLLEMRNLNPIINTEMQVSNTEELKEKFGHYHVILKIRPSWHTDTSNQKEVFMIKAQNQIIMLSTKTQKFGIPNFFIESELTPNATSDEIETEIRRFNSTFYKEQSKFTYKQIITGEQNYEIHR